MSSSSTRASAGGSAGPTPHVYPAWFGEDDRAIPATVEWDTVLIDNPTIVAYAGGLRVFPSGFDLQITAVLRSGGSRERNDDFEAWVRLGPVLPSREPVAADTLAAMFRVGVQFADGRGAVADPMVGPGISDPNRALPIVGFGRRHWEPGEAHATLRVFGIPEKGPVTLYYQWLKFGVPESSVTIDGEALRAAASRATVLWEHPGT